jgi:pSer/pThr/pTyr-binding forkhead associated (FHA) protein
MRSYTPRATPVVRAPAKSLPPVAEPLREGPPELRAPVTIITPVGDLELNDGSLLVGRLPECEVSLDDGLVSRMHARISVHDDRVLVEDLHSTNGVYVNGVRITHSAVLREGDRLLAGTTEISLFEARGSARIAPLRAKQTSAFAASPQSGRTPGRAAPTTPPARADSFGRLELHLDAPPIPAQGFGQPSFVGTAPFGAGQPSALRSRASELPSTARADALAVIGALAERLAAGGNFEEAARVLSSHLKRILQGASAGLSVSDEVCALAAKHAASLARWTGQSSWVDYLVELHLAARRCMTADTCTSLENAARAVGDLDRQLLRYYAGGLAERGTSLTAAQHSIVERLVALCHA